MNKKNFLFYLLNSILVYISGQLIFFGLNGSYQKRIKLITEFNSASFKYIFTGIVLFVLFLSFCILLFWLIKIQPFKQIEPKKIKKGFLISGWVIFFICFTLLAAKQWALTRFPIDQPDLVYFTLTNIQGTVDKTIYLEVFTIIFVCLIITLILFLPIFFYEKKTGFSNFSARFAKSINLNLLYFLFSLLILVASTLDLTKDLHLAKYAQVIKQYSQPAVESEFYKNEYIIPEYENIIFPQKKKNVIIIFVESMESSFADKNSGGIMNKNLIPNLTKLAQENINFSNTDKIGGGVDLSGTGWTIAGMLAKMAGLPYNLLGDEVQDCKDFLPGAITLNDILNKNGYNQLFIFGSDKHFAGRDALLETHGNVEIHDIEWYKAQNLLPKDYQVFWGFEDRKLYDYARTELDNISKNEKPFLFGFLTTDTHMPIGYQDEFCPKTEDMPLKNSIVYADLLLSSFLDWCKAQSWYDETVIIIMGDHLFMATSDTNPFDSDDYITSHNLKSDLEGMGQNPRRWFNLILNASPVKTTESYKNRYFSSFDMFPTILSAMGCEIKGDKLSFGVDLFSGEKTLCERFDENYINSQIMARNLQYEQMEFMLEK